MQGARSGAPWARKCDTLPTRTARPPVRPLHWHTNAKFRVVCGEGFLARKRMAIRVLLSINNLEGQGSQLFSSFQKNIIEFLGLNEQTQKFGLGSFDLIFYTLTKIMINGKVEHYAI